MREEKDRQTMGKYVIKKEKVYKGEKDKQFGYIAYMERERDKIVINNLLLLSFCYQTCTVNSP